MKITLTLLLLLAFLPGTAGAAERIVDYEVDIDIQADASLEVTERIAVQAEGSNIRRGIYRDFPTRYRDRAGNNVVVDLEVIEVQRNGQPEPWFTERVANGVRINTGNDDFLPVPAKHTFTLRYRTTRQIGFFADHDELYFNAIGLGWAFPIENGRVQVRLPAPVPVDQLRIEGYSGPAGAQRQDFHAEATGPGVARWQLRRALAPAEGLTIVLGFPKGLLPEPTQAQRTGWLLKDNRGVLVALAGLLLMLAYCVRRWQQVGRDPAKGTVIARYEPPAGHTPAGLRFMRKMGYDHRCFSADVLALAVDGHLRIERDKKLLKDDWRLEKPPAGPDSAGIDFGQRTLLDKLFPNNKARLELKNTNATTVAAAQAAHTKALTKRFEPALFNRHHGSVAVAFVIAAGSAALAFVLSGGAGIPLIIATGVLMLLVLAVFARLVRAPTPEGRRLLDEIEGLKLYLGVAERDDLKRMEGPGGPPSLDAQRYERLLPYAVALEVEDAWSKKFTLAVGAAAAAAASAGIAWYRGGGVGDLGALSKAVGSSLSSTIASSSRPPGSSSGGGGGGSSGGGGGGGGGGGR
jgi:uncharacterized membrane protein YgcG